MKKVIVVTVLVILIIGIILWIKGSKVREIKSEIIINAPITQVWDTLMDFDNWNTWNPIVKVASGKALLGEKLNISMVGKNAPTYEPIIISYEKPKFFHWRAKMIAEFLMTNDKIFELQDNGSSTKLIHKELFSGMFVPLFWSKMEKGVPHMLESMNEALKNNLENTNN